jgi:hypothetical protein
MPEVLTKHPEVVIQVLKSGGARCGEGLPQNILTACPAESFCAMPGGETCVYGVADVGKMTQIQKSELAALVCSKSGGGCAVGRESGELVGSAALLLLLAGFALGRWTGRPRIRAAAAE